MAQEVQKKTRYSIARHFRRKTVTQPELVAPFKRALRAKINSMQLSNAQIYNADETVLESNSRKDICLSGGKDRPWTKVGERSCYIFGVHKYDRQPKSYSTADWKIKKTKSLQKRRTASDLSKFEIRLDDCDFIQGVVSQLLCKGSESLSENKQANHL